MSNSPPIIELRSVCKAFGPRVVLDRVSLSVQRGKTTVIMGRSGCGKSVLLKHIVGLLRPDAGEIYFEGQRIDALGESALIPVRRQISFVFQLNALFDSMSVGENVAFMMTQGAMRTAGGPRARRNVDALVQHCLEIVGLAGFEKKRPAELSGGEKKRVALARAIALDPPPKVILYDEPTAGLDPQRSDVINRLIRHLQAQYQVTGIVVSHDMHSVAAVADRALLLHEGRFIADGAPNELAKAEDERVRRFVEGRADPDDLRALSELRA